MILLYCQTSISIVVKKNFFLNQTSLKNFGEYSQITNRTRTRLAYLFNYTIGMLKYYNRALTFEELVLQLSSVKDTTCYILISDPTLYYSHHSNDTIKLSWKAIHNLNNCRLILIESWSEIKEFVSNIVDRCLLVFYGIFKTFIELGLNSNEGEKKNGFLQHHHQFCGWELNKLFHLLFLKQSMYGVDVIVNDGIEHDNDHVDGEPLIWGLQIPNVREKLRQDTTTTNQEEKMISLRVIFIKWFEMTNKIDYSTV